MVLTYRNAVFLWKELLEEPHGYCAVVYLTLYNRALSRGQLKIKEVISIWQIDMIIHVGGLRGDCAARLGLRDRGCSRSSIFRWREIIPIRSTKKAVHPPAEGNACLSPTRICPRPPLLARK